MSLFKIKIKGLENSILLVQMEYNSIVFKKINERIDHLYKEYDIYTFI
jgi:hypothetical protein